MEKKFAKKVNYSYIFDERLERVFSLWTNALIYKTLYSDHIDEIKFIKGKSYAEKGAKVLIKDKSKLCSEFEIVDVIKNDDFIKLLMTQTQVINSRKIESTIIYSFYWNSIQSQTLMVAEIIITDELIYTFFNEEYTLKEKTLIFRKFEEIMKKVPYYYEQIESIIINKGIDKVWEVITDFEQFKNYSPGLGDHVVYEGEPREVNTKIHIYFDNNAKEFHMKVVESKNEDDRRLFKLTYINGVPKAPAQDVVFEVVSYSESKCLFIFKHVFKKYIKFSLITKIGQEKKEMLKKIKETFDKERPTVINK